MVALEDQPNACWPVELTDTTSYDKGEVTARSGLQSFFFTVFHMWSAAVETVRTPHPPPPPPLTLKENNIIFTVPVSS